MELLKELCAIHAPSGSEEPLKDFLIGYIKKHAGKWKVKPQILDDEKLFQGGFALVFGKPRTAIFAHMDSIGFTVRYGKELVKIGGPRVKNGFKLSGKDNEGDIDVKLSVREDGKLSYSGKRNLERGTTLTFKPEWKETKDYVQCCYMDNRLGIYNALAVAETLKDGIICFTCYEEHMGGNANVFGRWMYETYNITQAMISDITWVTPGIRPGLGAAVSLRDSGVPRKKFIDKIVALVRKSEIPFQLEVEDAGGSDGSALQKSAWPIDWCFIGAPEQNVHSPTEKVHKADIESMISLYRYLMPKL